MDLPPPAPPPEYRLAVPDHRAELGLQAGYIFGSNVSTSQGDVGVDEGTGYSVVLNVMTRPGTDAEASYTYLPTDLTLRRFGGPETKIVDMDVHFFQVGVVQELMRKQARPFIGLGLGITNFNPHASYDNELRFSVAPEIGLKVMAGNRVGFRAQGRLITTVLSTSSSLFCGTGGCSLGFLGAGLWQLEFAGGFFVAF